MRPARGGDRRLRVTWTESGGPPVAPPIKPTGQRGFGTRLIADGLAHQLDGEIGLDFDPTGLRCAIDIPLPEGHHDIL